MHDKKKKNTVVHRVVNHVKHVSYERTTMLPHARVCTNTVADGQSTVQTGWTKHHTSATMLLHAHVCTNVNKRYKQVGQSIHSLKTNFGSHVLTVAGGGKMLCVAKAIE